jgi:hypothetical protein
VGHGLQLKFGQDEPHWDNAIPADLEGMESTVLITMGITLQVEGRAGAKSPIAGCS